MGSNNPDKLPAIYITHGGGPCFFMDWNPPDAWIKTGGWLKNLSNTLSSRPKAILVISAHWEEQEFTVLDSPKPALLYDYYGFPEHTYKLKYEAPGAPELAKQVQELLLDNDIQVKTESKRGWDHGVFIPLKVIFPESDIPILQLSLKENLDPSDHIKLGRALQPLREQGVLIIGSGSSYHNLKAFNASGSDISKQFDDWLTDVISIDDQQEREKKLQNWEQAPAGKMAHPREEHLIPLMVVEGAASSNEKGNKVFSDQVAGVTISSFQFG